MRTSRSPTGPLQSRVTADSKTDQIMTSDFTRAAARAWGVKNNITRSITQTATAPHTAHLRRFHMPIPKMIRGTIWNS